VTEQAANAGISRIIPYLPKVFQVIFIVHGLLFFGSSLCRPEIVIDPTIKQSNTEYTAYSHARQYTVSQDG
jgi:hypothetical protein